MGENSGVWFSNGNKWFCVRPYNLARNIKYIFLLDNIFSTKNEMFYLEMQLSGSFLQSSL